MKWTIHNLPVFISFVVIFGAFQSTTLSIGRWRLLKRARRQEAFFVSNSLLKSGPIQRVKSGAAVPKAREGPNHTSPRPLDEGSDCLYQSLGFSGNTTNLLYPGLNQGCNRRRPLLRLFGSLFRPKAPGSLILLRCGQSEFNSNHTFTGWADPDLTPQGLAECERAAQVLIKEGYEVDVVYTSRLKRAIKSAWLVLQAMDCVFVPVHKCWRLNQRMYGAVEGLSKVVTAQLVGQTTVQSWRNSLKAKPPPLSTLDPGHPVHDRRYSDVEPAALPSTESLSDCQFRAEPLRDRLLSDIREGRTALVVAHRDTLRGLIKAIEGTFLSRTDAAGTDALISAVRIPKGCPIVYKFQHGSNGDLQLALPQAIAPQKLMVPHTSAVYLEAPNYLQELLDRDRLWTNYLFLPDQKASGAMASGSGKRRGRSLKDALAELRQESDFGGGEGWTAATSTDRDAVKWTDDPSEFEDYDSSDDAHHGEQDSYRSSMQGHFPPALPLRPQAARFSSPAASSTSSSPTLSWLSSDRPYVVLIRHGRTPHNKLGLFTGWEDPHLAPEGVEDAKRAGRLLRRLGFEFDVVYTSWLTRAIQTALYLMIELDCVWLPMVKSWRLNERMYGDLTGKSKRRIAVEHGEEQLQKWRRGYNIRPPPTSSYSTKYPGNDLRRAQHVIDLPVSWTQTLLRSWETRRWVLHRKFPKTESLKDCMDRSIPFYTKVIRREAIDQGKRVLIASHENAIRGILMYLCDIPESAVSQLHVPNGVPLLYDVKGRCISLLEDGGNGDDGPTSRRVPLDFGPAAQYLFRQCELEDDRLLESGIASA